MSAPAGCKLIGRWRIVEADIWDRDYLDLCGPATMTITDDGHGEIAFGAIQVSLDVEYGRASVGFAFEGFDEMDEARGDGSAELFDDGSIEMEFTFHGGKEAVLKVKRDTSSITRQARGQSIMVFMVNPDQERQEQVFERVQRYEQLGADDQSIMLALCAQLWLDGLTINYATSSPITSGLRASIFETADDMSSTATRRTSLRSWATDAG